MTIKALAAAAVAAILVLAAPTMAHAAVTHEATLTGNVVEVSLDAETANANQQASVVIMKVGARYSAPATDDIVFVNEYTLDANGLLVFSATLPGGDLDDYVLAVNVAGATGRYLVSLDPLGPTPVEPQDPDDGGDPGPGGAGGTGGLAFTGTNLAVGAFLLLALGMLATGAILVLRRRRAGKA